MSSVSAVRVSVTAVLPLLIVQLLPSNTPGLAADYKIPKTKMEFTVGVFARRWRQRATASARAKVVQKRDGAKEE